MVAWTYESPSPGEFPGANVIFDAPRLLAPRAAMDLSSAPIPPIGPDDHVRGEGEAVVVYADLGCPHCAGAWAAAARRAAADRLPPLPGLQQAPALAGAAHGRRGRRGAGPLLRDGRLALRRPRPGRRSAPLGAGRAPRPRPDRFEAERRAEATRLRVRRDFESGIRAGVTSTPRSSSPERNTVGRRVCTLVAHENESSESKWPPTGRPEVKN